MRNSLGEAVGEKILRVYFEISGVVGGSCAVEEEVSNLGGVVGLGGLSGDVIMAGSSANVSEGITIRNSPLPVCPCESPPPPPLP